MQEKPGHCVVVNSKTLQHDLYFQHKGDEPHVKLLPTKVGTHALRGID